jgi:hypothetical protein
MANPELNYDFHKFQIPPVGFRWPKALALSALLGGLYGASLGSAIGALPGSADVIGTAAFLVALLFGVPGARYGFYFSLVNRNRVGRFFVGTFAAIGGAILGGGLATLIVLALGTILGAVGGWLVARAFLALQHGILRRLVAGVGGAVLGMFLGAILWAVRIHPAAAILGAGWGFGIGCIAGPLLLLILVARLRLPRPTPAGDRANSIDVTFREQDREVKF